ncbi:MAG: preprotein translocase subunit SecG [Candidatus Spechtbacteria bacterium RIFCSPLOWO2_02_FULL_38_8]|uniref:Protein-export membrane protein SecG n=1 Tax=Candidatus Spechtbacteria bacterium RIFCSPLOWO2_02_FULL_38_8 TaxID=1802164 RepID=A0A1G2HHB3_9BACT|nr:MAG: preprotein translocase subunit SecG [Candidatus Spechtbacteria bacterium RIFCSPLOWO2_02_FULL_38_8]
MRTILLVTQIVVSVALVASILLQKRGAGLGGAFGGGGSTYYQKRGAEKILYYATIVLSFLFIGLGFAILMFA